MAIEADEGLTTGRAQAQLQGWDPRLLVVRTEHMLKAQVLAQIRPVHPLAVPLA